MIRSCSHWIWVPRDATPTIASSDRLGELTSSLSPRNLIPSFLLLVGCHSKPAIARIPKRRDDRICLDLDQQGEFPLLLATAALGKRPSARIPCCNPVRENYPSTCESPAQADAILYSQLLYPFIDVFCFYLYNPSDFEVLATHVALWTQSQPAPRSEYPPRLLIILAGYRWKNWDEPAAMQRFRTLVDEKAAQPLDSFFPEVFFHHSRSGRFSIIRSCLVEHVQSVRQKRREAQVLFKPPHLNALFNRAFHDAGKSPTFSFDCLRASRQDFPVTPRMAIHIEDFVSLIPSARRLREFAAPVIASSILLDQYPPGMHLFKPAEVFHKLYNEICLKVARSTVQQGRDDGFLLPSAFTSSILTSFKLLFTQLMDGRAASSIHRTVLANYEEEWHQIRSSRSCFTCFTSVPQHTAQCGHAFCENCVQIFGESRDSDSWLLCLPKCPLCRSDIGLVVRIRPPTAGHGILCIDGGGVGGVIPSTVLELIQDSLGLPIPVQEHFSMAYGVSVGGLIVLGLYDKGWSAATCTFKLQTMAKEAFYTPSRGFLLFFVLLKWIHLALFGHLYSARGIESALVRVFGDREIMNPSYATVTGTKVGILAATSTRQPTTYLFTNYNGIGEARVGYVVHQGGNTVKTWEVARSTSAAPMYLPSKYMPGLGNLLDGGVVRNNPTIVGLSEFHALTLGRRPDFVINLGTGSSPRSELADERPQILRRYGWLSRLARAYLSHLQGERTWNDVTCIAKREDQAGSYYRFDIDVQGEIGLDDTASMPRLRSLVLQNVALHDTIEELAHRLFTALFYFELTVRPTPSNPRSHVQGKILCLRKAGDPALPLILRRLKNSILFVNRKKTRFRPVIDMHGNIGATVAFVACPSINMELQEENSNLIFPLSGSPYILQDLVSSSGLAASFGIRTHKRKAEYNLSEHRVQRRRLS